MEPDARSLPAGVQPGWTTAIGPRIVEIFPGAAVSTFAGPNQRNRAERAVFRGGVLICLALSGLRASRIGRREWELPGEENCVALVSPQPIEVASVATCQQTRRTVAVYLSSEALARFGTDLISWRSDRNETIHHSAITATARNLAQDLLHPDSLPQVRRLRSEALVLELLAGLAEQHDRPQAGWASHLPHSQARQAVHRARDLIAADPASRHTLCSIAHTAGLSVSSLKRDFQDAFDTSPIAFLREQRLQLGRMLIEQEGHSVSSAAYACGYDHPGNFAQAFRRRFGLAPSRLRPGTVRNGF